MSGEPPTQQDFEKVLNYGLSPLNPFLFPDPPTEGANLNQPHLQMPNAFNVPPPPIPATRKNVPKAVVPPQSANANPSSAISGGSTCNNAGKSRTVLSAPTAQARKNNQKTAHTGGITKNKGRNQSATQPKSAKPTPNKQQKAAKTNLVDTAKETPPVTEEKTSSLCSELYFPTSQIGFLCGKQGSNIKEMQTKTNTRIAISNEVNSSEKDPQSKVRIYASEQKHIDAAELLIMDTMAKIPTPSSDTSKTSGNTSNNSAKQSKDSSNVTKQSNQTKQPPASLLGATPHTPNTQGAKGLFLEMKIPSSEGGIVIGQKGKTLNDIQAKTSTKIVITKESAENGALSTVRISGEPANIAAAEILIFKQLAKSNKLIEWTCNDISSLVNPMLSTWNEAAVMNFQRNTGTFIQTGHTTLVLKAFTDKSLFMAKNQLIQMASSRGTNKNRGKGTPRN